MCLEVLRDPVHALIDAKKTKNKKKIVIMTVGVSVLFGIAAMIGSLHASTIVGNWLALLEVGLGVAFLGIFGIILIALFLALLTQVLGGKGTIADGLTVVSYSMVPVSVAGIIFALSSFITILALFGALVFALFFGIGLAMLYRGVRELFAVDMVTSMVAVSVLMLSLFVLVYALVLGLSLATGSFASLGAVA